MHDAPAKLTLSLRITGVRPDHYHTIDAEMVTLEWGDRLEFGPGDGLDVTGPRAWGVPASEANLVRRALAAIGRTAHVRLEKRVPAGAGLGGGSADAAAVLRWGGCTDMAVAAALGADVPFCLVGGRARVTGIGEVVEPLPFEAKTFTLLLPPFGTVTTGVYRTWDHLGGPTAPEPGGNDLEPAVLTMAPELKRWRDQLGDATGRTPRLAGSGSAWFVEGEFPGGDRIVTRSRPAFAEVG